MSNPTLILRFSYHILDPKHPSWKISRDNVVLRISEHMTEDEKMAVGEVLADRRVGPLLFGPIVIGAHPPGEIFYPNNSALLRMLQVAPMHEPGVEYLSMAESITTDYTLRLPIFRPPTDPFGPAAQERYTGAPFMSARPHPWATVFGFHILLICIHFGIFPVVEFKVGERQLLNPDDDDENPGPVGLLFEEFHTLHKLRTRYMFLKGLVSSNQPIRALTPLKLRTPTHTIDRDKMRVECITAYNEFLSDLDTRATDTRLPPAITETEMHSIRSGALDEGGEGGGAPLTPHKERAEEDEEDEDESKRGVREGGAPLVRGHQDPLCGII